MSNVLTFYSKKVYTVVCYSWWSYVNSCRNCNINKHQVNKHYCLLNHISIPDHLNLCEPLPSNVEPPICRADIPTVIFSYDHLEGVNRRHQLNATTETTLLSALSYFKTVEELGGQVSWALQKVNINFKNCEHLTCVFFV